MGRVLLFVGSTRALTINRCGTVVDQRTKALNLLHLIEIAVYVLYPLTSIPRHTTPYLPISSSESRLKVSSPD
jgi:hypothetical protein